MVLLNVTFVFVNTSNKFGSIPGTVCHTPSSTIYKRNAFDGGVKSQRKEQCKVSLHILMIQDVLPQFTFKTLDFGFQSKMSFNEWSLKVPEEHAVGLTANDYQSHASPKSAAQGKRF